VTYEGEIAGPGVFERGNTVNFMLAVAFPLGVQQGCQFLDTHSI
jgi:hypothetical protein